MNKNNGQSVSSPLCPPCVKLYNIILGEETDDIQYITWIIVYIIFLLSE